MSQTTELCRELESSFAALMEAAEKLNAQGKAGADLGEGWTPIAVMAHVAYWDDFQRRRMEAALTGASARTGFPRDAESNEERRDADCARTFDEVAEAAASARDKLAAFVRGRTDAQLETKYPEGQSILYLGGLVRHMVQHAREHTRQIESYVASG